MVCELVHDPIFLGRKSAPATKEDLQTARDLLDTLAAKLFRRRIPMKYENAISSVFLVALMAFMLFVTAHDIFKLIR